MGYVTSWAHACLSVCCGVSRATTEALSKLRSAVSTPLPPWGCDPCAPPQSPCPLHSSSSSSFASCLPALTLLLLVREGGPFGDTLTLVCSSPSACLPESITLKNSSSAAQGFADVQMICSGFFSNTSPPTQQLLPQFT